MSFLHYLQNRNNKELKHPVSFGFSAAKWSDYFREHSDGSKADANIHEFGLFLHQRLEKLRDCLQQLESHCALVTADDVVLRIVRNLNAGCLRAEAEGLEALKNRQTIAIEEIGHGRTIKSGAGTMLTQQEALEGMTDAARHVLRRAMQKDRGYGADDPAAPVWPIEESLLAATHLAQFYEAYERQWQAALWSGCTFTQAGPGRPYILSELDSTVATDSTIDLVRRSNKYHRDFTAARTMALSRSTMDEAILCRAADGGLIIRKLGQLSAELQQYCLGLAYQRFSILEDNTAGLLNEKLGTLKGVTLRKVLDAWLQLGCLACQDMMQARTLPPTSEDAADHLARPMRANDLNHALQSLLKVDEPQASVLLDFFTFDGKHIEQSLWQRPLLRHAGGLLLAWTPLLTSHPMRLLSNWSRETANLEIEHAKRGRAFEPEVVQAMLAAALHGALATKHFVLGPGIKIPDPRIGDIDALLVLDDTAFVLECRSVMHPATDHEFWDAINALRNKTTQAIRKRDYLRNNPLVLSSLIAKSPFASSNRKINRVVALVVSNSFLLEGENDAEPYFTHVDTLFNTLLCGGALFGDIGPDGQEVELQVNFFDSKTKPADALIRAISRPPKAEYYRQCLTVLDAPIPAIAETEPFGLFRQWTFTPPQPGTLGALLQRCSFAKHIIIK